MHDYIDLYDHWDFQLIHKIIGTVIIIAVVVLLLRHSVQSYQSLTIKLYQERKNLKHTRRYLKSFKTRIISHIYASPASFARVLVDEQQYKNFRFNVSSQAKISMSNTQQEISRKRQ